MKLNQEASSGYIHKFKNNFLFPLDDYLPFFFNERNSWLQGFGKISEILVRVGQSTVSAQKNLMGKETKVEKVYILDDFESQNKVLDFTF